MNNSTWQISKLSAFSGVMIGPGEYFWDYGGIVGVV
jgi:hypothetical protein